MINLYAVYDKASELYTSLIEETTDAAAIRGFLHACNSAGTAMAIQPSDYALYCVGSYDKSSGTIIACEHRKVQDGRRVDFD